MASELTVEYYSDKCIVVRGVPEHEAHLMTGIGGKLADRLKGGAGWIFPRKLEQKVIQTTGVSEIKQGEFYADRSDRTNRKPFAPNRSFAPAPLMSKPGGSTKPDNQSQLVSIERRLAKMENMLVKILKAVGANTVDPEDVEDEPQKIIPLLLNPKSKPVKKSGGLNHTPTEKATEKSSTKTTKKKKKKPSEEEYKNMIEGVTNLDVITVESVKTHFKLGKKRASNWITRLVKRKVIKLANDDGTVKTYEIRE